MTPTPSSAMDAHTAETAYRPKLRVRHDPAAGALDVEVDGVVSRALLLPPRDQAPPSSLCDAMRRAVAHPDTWIEVVQRDGLHPKEKR